MTWKPNVQTTIYIYTKPLDNSHIFRVEADCEFLDPTNGDGRPSLHVLASHHEYLHVVCTRKMVDDFLNLTTANQLGIDAIHETTGCNNDYGCNDKSFHVHCNHVHTNIPHLYTSCCQIEGKIDFIVHMKHEA